MIRARPFLRLFRHALCAGIPLISMYAVIALPHVSNTVILGCAIALLITVLLSFVPSTAGHTTLLCSSPSYELSALNRTYSLPQTPRAQSQNSTLVLLANANEIHPSRFVDPLHWMRSVTYQLSAHALDPARPAHTTFCISHCDLLPGFARFLQPFLRNRSTPITNQSFDAVLEHYATLVLNTLPSLRSLDLRFSMLQSLHSFTQLHADVSAQITALHKTFPHLEPIEIAFLPNPNTVLASNEALAHWAQALRTEPPKDVAHGIYASLRIALVSSLLAATLWSPVTEFHVQRSQLSNVLTLVQGLQRAVQRNETSAEKVLQLRELHLAFDNATRVRSQWVLRWGMDIYRLLSEPLLTTYLQQLHEIPSRIARAAEQQLQSLVNAPRTPCDAPGIAAIHASTDALESYLLLTRGEAGEPDLLANPSIRNAWLDRLFRSNGSLFALAHDLEPLLSQHFVQRLPQRNMQLVRTARETILSLSEPQLLVKTLVRDFNHQYSTLAIRPDDLNTRPDKLPVPFVVSPRTSSLHDCFDLQHDVLVPPAFTRRVWGGGASSPPMETDWYLTQSTPTLIRTLLDHDEGIVPGAPWIFDIPQLEFARFRRERLFAVRELYFAAYINAWTDALQHLRHVPDGRASLAWVEPFPKHIPLVNFGNQILQEFRLGTLSEEQIRIVESANSTTTPWTVQSELQYTISAPQFKSSYQTVRWEFRALFDSLFGSLAWTQHATQHADDAHQALDLNIPCDSFLANDQRRADWIATLDPQWKQLATEILFPIYPACLLRDAAGITPRW